MDFLFEEKLLAEKLKKFLSDDFIIYTEDYLRNNPGNFLLDGTVVKTIPDMLIKPKARLVSEFNFIDTLIPIEIKKFAELETNKYEDLMFQCHSYRFSSFKNIQPKLCLYFIDNYFESGKHLEYNYILSKDAKTPDYHVQKQIAQKRLIETLFGRFGIGEIITDDLGYTFRLKRQILFSKKQTEFSYNSKILNFWRGTKGTYKGF